MMGAVADVATYTPSAVADLFPAACGAGEFAEAGTEASDMVADVQRALTALGRDTEAFRLLFRREVSGQTDDQIAHAEYLSPDVVRLRIEQALRYLSDFLNGRF